MKHDSRSFAAAHAYRDAIGDRIRRFLPMVRRLAWHVHGSGRSGIDLEDLVQAGLVALTECAQRHAGPTEDGFAAYAKLRVRGAMVDLLRRHAPISRGAADRRRLLREKAAELSATLGREPTETELAAALGIAEATLAERRADSEPLRFETLDENYSDSDMAYADQGPDAFEILADSQMRERIIAAIADLPERLQLVIQLYFVEELNLAEIAAVINVSVPRVHQLKAQALDRLRVVLGDEAQIL